MKSAQILHPYYTNTKKKGKHKKGDMQKINGEIKTKTKIRLFELRNGGGGKVLANGARDRNLAKEYKNKRRNPATQTR